MQRRNAGAPDNLADHLDRRPAASGSVTGAPPPARLIVIEASEAAVAATVLSN